MQNYPTCRVGYWLFWKRERRRGRLWNIYRFSLSGTLYISLSLCSLRPILYIYMRWALCFFVPAGRYTIKRKTKKKENISRHQFDDSQQEDTSSTGFTTVSYDSILLLFSICFTFVALSRFLFKCACRLVHCAVQGVNDEASAFFFLWRAPILIPANFKRMYKYEQYDVPGYWTESL